MKTKQTYLEPEAIVLVLQNEAVICSSPGLEKGNVIDEDYELE